jgi:hypothetical protein
MILNSPLWTNLMVIIGEITVFLALGTVLGALLIIAVASYSIQKGHFFFPKAMKSGLVLLEGTVKAICKLFGLSDKELTTFFIRLHNAMNMKAFSEIPVEKRAIFFPQCLRNSRCPAHLTPEGLQCRNCGLCEIGSEKEKLEEMGYRVYIVPGSTFIKRLVKKYRPEGIIGVGCLMEIKEGLEMTDQIGLIGMGVVSLKDGCVETLVDWADVFEIAEVGLNPELSSREL